MSPVLYRCVRLHALCVATALACGSLAVPAIAGSADTASLRAGETYDSFLVTYRAGTSERASVAAAKDSLARAAGMAVAGKPVVLQHVRRMGIGTDVVSAGRKLDRVEAAALMRQLADDPGVQNVSVNFHVEGLFTPNDTYYAVRLWNLNKTWGVRADRAWDTTRGAGVVVAVVDSGVTDHADLNANLLPGYDFVSNTFNSNDGDGRDANPADPGTWVAANQCGNGNPAAASNWHGTHVAGIIGAVMNNNQGVAGVAADAKVVPVRVFGTCGGDIADVLDGLYWAAGGMVPGVPANAHPAEVINLSLGAPFPCIAPAQAAVDAVVGMGATVVVASGNSDADAAGFAPGNCNNVIAVSATDQNGARAQFAEGASNYGAVVDVSAPGKRVFSTVDSGATTPLAPYYNYLSGTSMAAPHVAAVAALIQSVAPMPKTPAQVEDLIKCTATPFPATPDQPIGTGIVNAERAALVAKAVPTTHHSMGGIATKRQMSVAKTVLVHAGIANASCHTQVFVNFNHANPANLLLTLVSPAGTAYALGTPQTANATFEVNLSAEARNGTWTLMVTDLSAGQPGTVTGSLLQWGMTFN